MIDNEPISMYCHIKTGGFYLFLGECLIESDKTKAVIYKSMADGRIWVRPSVEFFDGRFQPASAQIDPSPAPVSPTPDPKPAPSGHQTPQRKVYSVLGELVEFVDGRLQPAPPPAPINSKLVEIQIPIQVGFQRCDLSRRSAQELLKALNDWFDGDLPPDIADFRDILIPF